MKLSYYMSLLENKIDRLMILYCYRIKHCLTA